MSTADTGGKTVDPQPVTAPAGAPNVLLGTQHRSDAGMDIGRDNGRAVSMSYADRSPFPFTGTIDKVVFDLEPTPVEPTDRVERKHAKNRTKVAVGISG